MLRNASFDVVPDRDYIVRNSHFRMVPAYIAAADMASAENMAADMASAEDSEYHKGTAPKPVEDTAVDTALKQVAEDTAFVAVAV